MDKFFKFLLNNKSNSNVSISNDIYIPSEELHNIYSSSIPSTTQYIPSQELNNIYSSSVPQLNYTSYSSAMPSTTEYILSQELNNIYLSAVPIAPQQLIMESNHNTTVFNPSGYTGMYGINQTYGYTSGSTGINHSHITGLTGTNHSNIYNHGYTGTNNSHIYNHGYTGTNNSHIYNHGYTGMTGTNQSCSHKHAIYDKIKLVIKNELIFFEVLPNNNSRVYIYNYKGVTKNVILKINLKTGKPYANLKFMELVQILDDVRLNDNNNDIKKAIDTIIMNDPFIFNILHNKIKITI